MYYLLYSSLRHSFLDNRAHDLLPVVIKVANPEHSVVETSSFFIFRGTPKTEKHVIDVLSCFNHPLLSLGSFSPHPSIVRSHFRGHLDNIWYAYKDIDTDYYSFAINKAFFHSVKEMKLSTFLEAHYFEIPHTFLIPTSIPKPL